MLRSMSLLGLVLAVNTATFAEGETRQELSLSSEQRNALVRRVQARWKALGESKPDQLYQFQSPTYRSVFTPEMYSMRYAGTLQRELTSVEILNYDPGAAVASVAVGVMSRPTKQTSPASAVIAAKPVVLTEQWVERNKEWWFSVIK